METTGDIKCNICGDKPPEKGRKTCSACRKKLQRNKTEKFSMPRMKVGKKVAVVPKVEPYDLPSKNISSSHKGHWFGKAPHRPFWTSCDAKDCPHMNAPEPDWEVTCTNVCCSIG